MSDISRKAFFKGLGLSLLGMPFAIKSAMGSKTVESNESRSNGSQYTWKMVTTWPPNFPILGEACQLFADWVHEMSDGRMEIQVYGAGELVPALETFDAVRSGSVEMGNGAAYYWAGKIPAAQFFAAVPFGMNAQQINAWLINGGGLELWQELYAEYNLYPLPAGNTGVQMGGWYNREINTVEDLKGLKIRMPGLGGKVLKKVGASPVLIPGSELYTGLERGVIDATEWIGPYHDYAMGFHQIAKYYYANGWHETGTVLELIINKERFDALDSALQSIVRTAAMRANQWVLTASDANNSIYLAKIRNESDAELRYFSQEVLDHLRVKSHETIDELVSKDAWSKKVYDSYHAFAQQINEWSKISERQYYTKIIGE